MLLSGFVYYIPFVLINVSTHQYRFGSFFKLALIQSYIILTFIGVSRISKEQKYCKVSCHKQQLEKLQYIE